MTRTSHTHPLQIAEVHTGKGWGRIGITFCPGKKQPHAFTGAWDRDLDLDLDAVVNWGAAAVLTLVEQHELETLRVAGLGEAVRSRYISWFHLPIADVSTPCAEFEEQWRTAGEQLRSLMRSGFNVMVHCKGGLGRAGMIAARLLVELGHEPNSGRSSGPAATPGCAGDLRTRARGAFTCSYP